MKLWQDHNYEPVPKPGLLNMRGLPPNHVHKIYRKLPFQTLPWMTVRVTMLQNLSSKQVFDCSTYMRSTVSCMAILILYSCPTCGWACFKIVWRIKSWDIRPNGCTLGVETSHTPNTDRSGWQNHNTICTMLCILWLYTYTHRVHRRCGWCVFGYQNNKKTKSMRWWLGAHTSRSRESAGPQHCGGIWWMVLDKRIQLMWVIQYLGIYHQQTL